MRPATTAPSGGIRPAGGPADTAATAVTPRAWRLSLVVLAGGAGSLSVEICASRLLAPFFGSSTVVWANIIGLILVYLAVGYWIGGRVADRHATARSLGVVVVAAAACIAVLPFVARPVLRVALDGLDALSVGAVVGSFAATLALFSVPVTLLGMVSPFAVRLALRDVGEAGTVSGRLYALSTLGSMAGTFVPALLTIPLVGTQRTMVGTALLLTAAAALLLGVRWTAAVAAVAALLLVPTGAVKESAGLVFETESQYQYVQVSRHQGALRIQLNEGVSDQSVWRPNTVLTGGEWDMFLVVPPLLDHPVRRVLVIGDGGGTIPRAYSVFYPQARVDGVELDPAVTAAGARYMGLDGIPTLRTFTADGRVFLEQHSDRYDLILVDAYRSDYIPFYLATQEFFSLCRDHLAPGGAVALNVARVPGDDRLASAVRGTLATEFPQTWRWPALRFNELVVGLTAPVDRATLGRRVDSLAPALQPLVPLVRAGVEPVAPAADPMTDDRAPVEWLTDRMILHRVAQGGGLDEQLLPTAP